MKNCPVLLGIYIASFARENMKTSLLSKRGQFINGVCHITQPGIFKRIEDIPDQERRIILAQICLIVT